MLTKLAGVHPTLADAIERIEIALQALGHPIIITEGVRSLARQQVLYAQGRSQPGHIVTNCDGVRHLSLHQLQADGFGHAVDVAFVRDGKPDWDSKHPWHLYGAMGKFFGLTWGGDFTVLSDRPHLELPLKGSDI